MSYVCVYVYFCMCYSYSFLQKRERSFQTCGSLGPTKFCFLFLFFPQILLKELLITSSHQGPNLVTQNVTYLSAIGAQKLIVFKTQSGTSSGLGKKHQLPFRKKTPRSLSSFPVPQSWALCFRMTIPYHPPPLQPLFIAPLNACVDQQVCPWWPKAKFAILQQHHFEKSS